MHAFGFAVLATFFVCSLGVSQHHRGERAKGSPKSGDFETQVDEEMTIITQITLISPK